MFIEKITLERIKLNYQAQSVQRPKIFIVILFEFFERSYVSIKLKY